MRRFVVRAAAARALALLAFAALALLAGCAAPQAGALLQAPPADLPPRAELRDVPFHPQEDYQCGPAALAMVMQAAGSTRTPEDLAARVFVPARAGSFQVEMLAAPRRDGLLAVRAPTDLDGLLHEVAAGTPVLVFQNLSLPIWPIWHYAVVVGYDLGRGEIVLNSGRNARLAVSLHAFERTWARGEYWAMTVTPPERLPRMAREIDVAQAAAALERSNAVAALTAYEAMLARWPGDRVALFGRGNALYAQGRAAAAADAWRATVAAHPDFADAWNNLAQALADTGRRDEALAAVARALELGGPHRAAYETTRAQIEGAPR